MFRSELEVEVTTRLHLATSHPVVCMTRRPLHLLAIHLMTRNYSVLCGDGCVPPSPGYRYEQGSVFRASVDVMPRAILGM